ncbi:MAG: hypothetical protein KDK36_14235 [Leptospiraceae bacterium]|nr:hypothetical protein [Leptospiraceae bacterium]
MFHKLFSICLILIFFSISFCSSPPKKEVKEDEKEEVRAPLKPAPLPSPSK